MTKTLLANIESIPALPESVQEVERIYHDSESTFEDMQKAIEKDPLLTANILRIVNSPAYGIKSNITGVKQAISLLGKDAVRTFVLASAVDSNFEIDLSPYNMTKEEFALACDRQLSLTINWLIRKESKNLAILAPAAFLVDIGRVIIAKTLVEDDKVDIIQQALLAGEDISSAEKTACGAQTTDVTATLFHKWGLDPEVVHIIRYSDDPEGTGPEEQRMAAELKAVRETVMPNGEITDESIETAKETIEEFDLDLESYEKALEKILEA
ncbi:HDOD domain-containing protein [Sulfurimonas paralvinellae]|uniref:HDOD domain-containing protein n=1 Tax=Sulfurimonas paralvinellae TaxID=317658 RepID=A0A7M1B7E9_9BACT|nr:HDOD domain-containing protein [Sulfurimonas paralvinellae]QOP45575.1 HDOD domain-containing protein [Sulfurimonas paralvinellae]